MSSSSAFAAHNVPSFEVNTYDRDGRPMLLVGRFDSIEAAQAGISDHAGVRLDWLRDNNYAGSVLPSIVESWFIGSVEYIIHRAA